LNQAPAEELVPPGGAYAALERAVDVGIAALCAEGVGAMDRLVPEPEATTALPGLRP